MINSSQSDTEKVSKIILDTINSDALSLMLAKQWKTQAEME